MGFCCCWFNKYCYVVFFNPQSTALRAGIALTLVQKRDRISRIALTLLYTYCFFTTFLVIAVIPMIVPLTPLHAYCLFTTFLVIAVIPMIVPLTPLHAYCFFSTFLVVAVIPRIAPLTLLYGYCLFTTLPVIAVCVIGCCQMESIFKYTTYCIRHLK